MSDFTLMDHAHLCLNSYETYRNVQLCFASNSLCPGMDMAALVAFIDLGLDFGLGLGVPPQFRWLLLRKASCLQSSNYAVPKTN